ncbi:hypothetical protein TCSYLVIO_004165 [Trypanosoma cruzi]|nr:hypothetical protein TCSYLVIO_004165 [Trypanosoma cruzi]
MFVLFCSARAHSSKRETTDQQIRRERQRIGVHSLLSPSPPSAGRQRHLLAPPHTHTKPAAGRDHAKNPQKHRKQTVLQRRSCDSNAKSRSAPTQQPPTHTKRGKGGGGKPAPKINRNGMKRKQCTLHYTSIKCHRSSKHPPPQTGTHRHKPPNAPATCTFARNTAASSWNATPPQCLHQRRRHQDAEHVQITITNCRVVLQENGKKKKKENAAKAHTAKPQYQKPKSKPEAHKP